MSKISNVVSCEPLHYGRKYLSGKADKGLSMPQAGHFISPSLLSVLHAYQKDSNLGEIRQLKLFNRNSKKVAVKLHVVSHGALGNDKAAE
jgi:hypothetical protein